MNKSVVIVPLGRFSPPHKEHESLVNAVLKLAKSTRSDAKIFVSRTVDKKKNPLTPQEKIKYLNKMFPGHKGLFDMPPANNPTMIGSLAELSGKYDTVHIVLGDDRVAATETLVNKYNGKDFTFDKIVVHSRHSIISTRVGDADGVHASDIRDWARAGDFDKVRESMSKHLSDADVKEIMRLIQSRLGSTVKESALDDLFMEYIIESDEPTITFPSDSEMSKHIDSMSDDELDLDDSDVLMLDVIVGQDIEKEDVSEARVLSIQTRQKLAQRMKGMSKRLARLRQIKAKTMPAQQRLRMRARKAAIMMLRRRATGKKNLEYSSLSKSQRIAVDNALVQRFGKSLNSAVDKLSKRIMPMIRKKAQANVAKARDTNESFTNFMFEAKDKEGTAADVKSDIKQAKKRGISVSDWEKSKADKAHDSPLDIDATKLDNLSIDPLGNDRSAPNSKAGHLHLNRKLSHYARSVDEGRKSAIDKDARDAGDTNIIYQMRKTINSRGEHETVFADKHKANISVSDAKKLLAKFDALRMPADKHKFTIAAGKSLQSFRDVMAHGIPKDKPKISLGGKQFNEFYLGVGRARTVSPYDKDEPPGVRNVGEVAKDEDRPTDPNRSRPLSQKLDLLLRLGLSDGEELQKYRRALRSSKKHALQSPQMREALADLLDKLIDLTTKDPATYSRVRYNVVNKEANALLRKASESGVPVEIIYEVFSRGFEVNNNMNEAFGRVNSFIAGGFAAKLDEDLVEDGKGYSSPTGGLTQKGRDHYNRTTGGNLQAPVTTSPSKLKAGSKAAGRRRSFCARMGGVDGPMKKPNGEPTRKALALRKWNCRSEDTQVDEKRGLWDNIHAKRARIKAGSGERMRKPGSEGAPSTLDLKTARTEAANAAQQAAIAIAMKKAGKTPKNEMDEASDAGLAAKASKSGVSIGTLRKVYRRGVAAWNSGHRPGTTPQQWGMARVNSYITKGKGTYHGADKDLREEEFLEGDTSNLSRVSKDKESGLPNKYVAGLSTSTAKARAAHFKKTDKLSDSDPRAYEPAPGDANTKTKPSKHTLKYRAMYGESMDEEILEACWDSYKQVGVKMKNGRSVPNCVPKEETQKEGQANWARARKENERSSVANLNQPKKSYVDRKYTPMKSDEKERVTAATKDFVSKGGTIQKIAPGKKTIKSFVRPKKYMAPNQASRVTEDINYAFEAYIGSEPASKDKNDPKNRFVGTDAIVQNYADATPGQGKIVKEATYKGKTVSLNKPMAGDVKKSKVYVDPDGDGKAKKVNFGDKTLSIKKDQPARKRSYCARSSGQGNLSNKSSANYWSRRAWDC